MEVSDACCNRSDSLLMLFSGHFRVDLDSAMAIVRFGPEFLLSIVQVTVKGKRDRRIDAQV